MAISPADFEQLEGRLSPGNNPESIRGWNLYVDDFATVSDVAKTLCEDLSYFRSTHVLPIQVGGLARLHGRLWSPSPIDDLLARAERGLDSRRVGLTTKL